MWTLELEKWNEANIGPHEVEIISPFSSALIEKPVPKKKAASTLDVVRSSRTFFPITLSYS
jgi:hypothetical protein